MTYTLNDKSKVRIEEKVGVSFDEIISSNAMDLDKHVERKIGKKLSHSPISDNRLIGRGSPFLYLGRFITFNTKKLDKYISSIK